MLTVVHPTHQTVILFRHLLALFLLCSPFLRWPLPLCCFAGLVCLVLFCHIFLWGVWRINGEIFPDNTSYMSLILNPFIVLNTNICRTATSCLVLRCRAVTTPLFRTTVLVVTVWWRTTPTADDSHHHLVPSPRSRWRKVVMQEDRRSGGERIIGHYRQIYK